MSCLRRLAASDEVENVRTEGRVMIVTDVGEKWVSPRFFCVFGNAAMCGYRYSDRDRLNTTEWAVGARMQKNQGSTVMALPQTIFI